MMGAAEGAKGLSSLRLPDGFTEVFTSRLVELNGLRLHAVTGGDGPPLLLAGAQLLNSLLAPVFPGFSVLAPPWRVLAASAVDVAAAAALARLVTAVQPSKGSRTGER